MQKNYSSGIRPLPDCCQIDVFTHSGLMKDCLICSRVKLIKEGENPYFVKELETGYVVLGDFQYYRGYTLFLSKIHAEELHQLETTTMKKFLVEMAQVSSAVYNAFKPHKLNYELLGNGDPHLHWHIFPRYRSDPGLTSPVWSIDKSIRNAESARPSNKQLEEMKKQLLKYL